MPAFRPFSIEIASLSELGCACAALFCSVGVEQLCSRLYFAPGCGRLVCGMEMAERFPLHVQSAVELVLHLRPRSYRL